LESKIPTLVVDVEKHKINQLQNREQFVTFTFGWGNKGINSPWMSKYPSIVMED